MLIVMLTVAFVFVGSVDACPNCRNNLELQRAAAYGVSILLLMSMPFTIGAFWFYAILRSAPSAAEESEVQGKGQ